MKKFTLFFLLAGSVAFAQQNFTIEETVMGGRKYAPTTQTAQQWRKNSKSVTYLSADYANLLEKSAATAWKESVLATKGDFESALKAKIANDEFQVRMFPFAIEWKTTNTFDTEVTGKKNNYKVTYDVVAKQITNVITYSNEGTQAKFASNGNVAWLKDNNIRITANGNVIEVTNDQNPAIVNGSDYVHRQEFGIDRGNVGGTKPEHS